MSATAPSSLIVTTATGGVVDTAITLANANAMSAAGEAFIEASDSSQVQLDMAKVAPSSVAVAVALSWLASAQRHRKELCLSNLSADFSGVIEFSGIASMFAEHISSDA